MRLIDSAKEITKLQEMLDVLIDEEDKAAVRFALNVLNGAETVDAVEVDRCKGCGYFDEDGYCSRYSYNMSEDDYCSKSC